MKFPRFCYLLNLRFNSAACILLRVQSQTNTGIGRTTSLPHIQPGAWICCCTTWGKWGNREVMGQGRVYQAQEWDEFGSSGIAKS